MSQKGRLLPKWFFQLGEWFFALLGAAICIGAAVEFSSLQPDRLWPTPGLYFVELIMLALVVLVSRVKDTAPAGLDYGAVPWIAGGILLAFVILGGFTIGPFLFPAMVAFCLAAIRGDIRQGRSLRRHVGLPLLAAVFQAALIGLFLLMSTFE